MILPGGKQTVVNPLTVRFASNIAARNLRIIIPRPHRITRRHRSATSSTGIAAGKQLPSRTITMKTAFAGCVCTAASIPAEKQPAVSPRAAKKCSTPYGEIDLDDHTNAEYELTDEIHKKHVCAGLYNSCRKTHMGKRNSKRNL